MTREEMINQLRDVNNRLYSKWGTDSYEERCQLFDIRTELVKAEEREKIAAVKSSLPPAEGAEEYFLKALGMPNVPKHKVILHWYDITTLMSEFAALTADKMVSERLREELIGYDKFLSNTYWGISHIIKRDEAVDEYLNGRNK